MTSRSLLERILAAWDRYWFDPAPYLDLAVCRIALVATQLGLLLTNEVYDLSRIRELAGLPGSWYDPLPVLRLLMLSPSGAFRPSLTLLLGIYVGTLVTGVLSLIGFRTRTSLFLFALGNVFLQSFSYSFGDFHHPEALMMFGLFALAFSPSGAALSLDSHSKGHGPKPSFAPRDRAASRGSSAELPSSPFARWPLLLLQWMIALIYLDSAVNKIYRSGLDWMNGHTLRWVLYNHGYDRGSDLALWMADHHTISAALSWLTVAWEGTFILAVLIPVLSLIYVPLGIAMHVGMCVLRIACFYQFIAVYSVFVPWARIYRGTRRSLGGAPVVGEGTEVSRSAARSL